MLCLAALVQRAKAEYDLHPADGDVPGRPGWPPATAGERINSWLKENDLWASASSEEKRLLDKPLGGWSKQEIANGQWREESMAILLWALYAEYAMPAFDQPAFATDIMKSAPTPLGVAEFLRNPTLRSRSEISKARDIAELWLWRARTTQLQRDGTSVARDNNLENIIAMTAEKAKEDGLFLPIKRNFPALGKSYRELSEAEWNTLNSIATERLYALNWLCGYADDWDDVPTGT